MRRAGRTHRAAFRRTEKIEPWVKDPVPGHATDEGDRADLGHAVPEPYGEEQERLADLEIAHDSGAMRNYRGRNGGFSRAEAQSLFRRFVGPT